MINRTTAELHDSRRIPEAQAGFSWSPPGGTLGTLVKEAAFRVERLRPRAGELERAAAASKAPPKFADAFATDRVAVIAEIKRRSPSKGSLNASLAAGEQAGKFELGGARAVSVLTESSRFGGSLEDLRNARSGCTLPLLRKDFLVDALQLMEARIFGASAVLLIARGLEPTALAELAHLARELGMEPLVEVRDERELDAALKADAMFIGVNSRNLETLVVDAAIFQSLLPKIPGDRIAIAESGIGTAADVRTVAGFGADAVLVGSALSLSGDPADALRMMTGVERRGRG